MPDDPGNNPPGRNDDPSYRIYRAGPSRRARSEPPQRPERDAERPYTTYRATPRGLRERLRDPDGAGLRELRRRGRAAGTPSTAGTPSAEETPLADPKRPSRLRPLPRRPITPWRALRWVVVAVVAWLVLSLVLFLVSAQIESGSGLPKAAGRALASGPNMLTGTDTVLVLGLDQRPKGSREPGAFAGGIRSDSIMLWRIGGGTSRRLSIPRDTVAEIPGHGATKINAAYSYGGAALAIRTIEGFTGIRGINHLIVLNLANFPKFIDAIGGVDVHTGRICSNISGGVRNGGFSLHLKPGDHHLNGSQALTLARTRENGCDAASNDLTRDAYQQKILNAIKGKLTSPTIFFHLPWTAWRAPQAVRTDMGGPTMLSLFLASEVGGSAPTDVLHPSASETLPDGEDALVATPEQVRRAVRRLMNGR